MIGIGLSPGSAPPVVAASGGEENPNLLLWTEELDNAVWSQTSVVLLADAGASPLGGINAELLAFQSSAGAVRQISASAASSGAAVTNGIFDVATEWTRYEVTGSFDATDYVFSVYLKQSEAGIAQRIRLDRSGGFLRCSVEDLGDVGAVYAWGAQLELGTTATAYQRRGGT